MFLDDWRAGALTFSLQTSGSTGTPKIISLSRAQLEASARLTGKTFGLVPGDRALVCLNTGYIAGVMMLVRGEVLGLRLTVVPPSANPLLAFDPRTTRFEFAAFVPLQLQTILADTGTLGESRWAPLLNGMKAILVGGATTSPALETACQAIGAPIYSTYGMTETVSHVAIRRLNGPDRSLLFRVLPGVEVSIDDRQCLRITAAATNFLPVQTNDVVELFAPQQPTDPWHFRLLGRADSIINTGGVKVQPERVEQAVSTYLATQHLAQRLFVAGLPDERLGQRVVLFLENTPLSDTHWQGIRRAVEISCGPYAVPKEWRTMPEFPETATGKIDRLRVMGTFA